ncbi:MAG: VWA domain-containing protein [Desulfotalea sp.]
MNNNLVIKSLPLVAAVLGRKYGVEVRIGGKQAFALGNVINLPGLPTDSDDSVISGLARGYIDHESAHIRYTDFLAIPAAKLTPLERFIMNSIEDWRVENKLAEIFAGCRRNFNWLIQYSFLNKRDESEIAIDNSAIIPNWILLSVRSWDEPKLLVRVDGLEQQITTHYGGLLQKLQRVLVSVKASCTSTQDSIAFAKLIAELLAHEFTQEKDNSTNKAQLGKRDHISNADTQQDQKKEISKEVNKNSDLSSLVKAKADDLPKTIGEILTEELDNSSLKLIGDKLEVATVGMMGHTEFSFNQQKEIARAVSGIKLRLKSLLQSTALKRDKISRRGKLCNQRLSRLSTGNPRIFLSHEEKKAMNTAIHILVDCSGSMRKKMDLTSSSCLALAKGLDAIDGINVAVTAFPANNWERQESGSSVAPIVEHGEIVHSKFKMTARGNTPMGESLWWVLQKMVLLKETRKIILIITDGRPNSIKNTVAALKAGEELGVEFYAVGIGYMGVKDLFPHNSCVVDNLSDLSGSMFALLKDTIIKK